MSFEVCFVIGGGKTVFDDLQKAYALTKPDCIVAANDIGADHEDVDHWASMHPDKVVKWLERRRGYGYPDPKKFWTSHCRKRPNSIKWETIPNTKGGSGLLAIYVARKLGYQKIILCGIPMDKKYNHYFNAKVWNECNIYRAVWENNSSLIKRDDVRSLSGWTMKRFGEPTPEWLTRAPQAAKGHARV